MEAVVYLDTNVVLWLAGAPSELSPSAKRIVDDADELLLSPMVYLEIEYLYEIGRIQQPATVVLGHLQAALTLRHCSRAFSAVVQTAAKLKWTRDPFDRLITAQAAVGNNTLLTRDKIIRANYPQATW